jgi:hypothetical protein
MAYIPEPGKGRLFNNQAEKTKDKQADWSGTAVTPGGEHIHISGWYYPPSETQRVGTISMSIENYQERQDRIAASKARKAQDGAAEHGQPPASDDHGSQDDIPF